MDGPSEGRRVVLTFSEPVSAAQLRAALGSDVASIAPVEKKDVPADAETLWMVRAVQQAALSTALSSPRRAVLLAAAGDAYVTTDADASAEAADAAEESITVTGCVLGGLLYAEAPELPAVLLAQAASALGCLYDLAPLRPGLRLVRDELATPTECADAVRAVRQALVDAVNGLPQGGVMVRGPAAGGLVGGAGLRAPTRRQSSCASTRATTARSGCSSSDASWAR